MLNELQKKTAQAIVNIFETSKVTGDYGKVTLLANDTGHLTYGRSQTTLASGNLCLLLKSYSQAPGARLAGELSPYLPRLDACDLTLDHDMQFRSLLQAAGDDPVMRSTQDQFFDRVYWNPAVQRATSIGISSALGVSVVYDSCVHGSWILVRDRTTQTCGQLAVLGEKQWIASYVATRKAWLQNHSNSLLHKTVYRMESFRQLITENRWDLDLPISVHGRRIDADSLQEKPVVLASAQSPGERTLKLQDPPLMQGDDVREVQEALERAGIPVHADGKFGSNTKRAILTPEQYDRFNRALAYDQLGRVEEGNAAYAKAVALDTNDASLYNSSGYFLYRTGEFGQDTHYLERALRLDPTHPKATMTPRTARSAEVAPSSPHDDRVVPGDPIHGLRSMLLSTDHRPLTEDRNAG